MTYDNELNVEEVIRYSRHFTLPQIGKEGQKLLKSARVLCVGAGGLGSAALQYLAASGVGTVGIVDDDIVELSNLQRQILYSTNEIKRKKIEVAQSRLSSLNPNINIIIHDVRLNENNALEIIHQYDLVVDGSDNFATRYLINDACFHLKKPDIYAGVFQFEGQCSVFMDQGPCYRCLYPNPPPPGLMPNCAEGGVLGVLPGIMGTIQAAEAIKLILGIGKSLKGRLLIFEALTMTLQEVKVDTNPECLLCRYQKPFITLPYHTMPICSDTLTNTDSITANDLKDFFNNNVDFFLLDVRESFEYAICNLGGYLIPLSQLPKRIKELDHNKLIIVYCKMGGRSLQAVKFLQEKGFKAKNLEGGIISWIKKIDNSMQEY